MKTTKFSGILVIAVTLVSVLASASFLTSGMGQTADEKAYVLLFTDRATAAESAVAISLGLDDRIVVDVMTAAEDFPGAIQNQSVYNMSKYDVVITDCYLPVNDSDLTYLFSEITKRNIGLLFFGGNYSASLGIFEPILPAYFTVDKDSVNETMGEALIGSTGFTDGPLSPYHEMVLNETMEFTIMENQIQVAISDEESSKEDDDPTLTPFTVNIAWQSCPLLRERVSTFAKKDGARTLVEVPDTTEEPLIVLAKMNVLAEVDSNASVLFISTGVGIYNKTNDDGTEEKIMNEAFSLWPYFNYLMYMSVYFLKEDFDNSRIETYSEWPYSPIPHQKEATIWMIFVGSLWVFNFALFYTLGKKKKAKEAQGSSVGNDIIPPSDDGKPADSTEEIPPSES